MKLDSRISLQKLEAFCLVVRLGSVSRAAEEMFVTQPVVSAHLHSLQERVGVPLLQRVGRGLELTEAGRAVHAWAEELLRRRDDLAQELDAMADGTAGAVHIGASMTVGNYLLTPALMEFRRENPSARLTLQISTPEDATEAVSAGRSDFCVIASYGTVSSDRLEARMIGKQRFVLVGAPTDSSLPDRVSVEELRAMPFVCPPGGQSIRRSQDAALAALGVTHREVVIELGSAEAIKQAVQGHLGVAVLWESSVRADLEEGRLREIEIDAPEMVDSLYIQKLAGRHFTPLQQRLYDRLSHVISDSPPGRALQPQR
jgi:DNA-binding transcriptional LysR family regulator